MTRIAISGYYGFDNAGDEAVLAGLVRSLRAEAPDAAITALSIDPAGTTRDHGIDAAHRYRPAELLGTLRRSDLLLSGGGSLLQDVTSAHGIFYYAAVLRIAQMMGRRTMMAAQGVGPLVRPRSRRLVAGVANRCDAITVRDPESEALLQEIGVTRKVEVTADPALLLAGDPEDGDMGVAVSLRPWEGAEELAERLARICARYLSGYNMATLAMQPGKDAGIMEQFEQSFTQTTGSRPAELAPPGGGANGGERLSAIVRGLGASRLAIGMRLHTLIIAAGAGVPSIAFGYDPKVESFMRSTGQEDAVCAVDIDEQTLAGVVGRIANSVGERRAALRARLPDLRQAARRNAQIAIMSIGNRR